MSELEKPKEAPLEPVQEPAQIAFAEFLESTPPSQLTKVTNVFELGHYSTGGKYYELEIPQLQLHCTSDDCNGLRFFRYRDGDRLRHEVQPKAGLTYLQYVCSNCRSRRKIFSLQVQPDEKETTAGQCYKFGETPAYGPPTPARLIRLFQSEREIFLKGRRCENQGLGIGAFVYYRRVVETQKDRILAEIIKVCKAIGAPAEMIRALDDATKEIQFSKALASVKDAIPHALLINGHNPLTLLHSALSSGLHEKTDERCLELAHDIRVLLVELAERLGQLLKDEAELNTAVTRLMKANQDR